MRITILFVAGSLGVLLAGQWTPQAATSQERDGAERPYGIEKRAFWTGSIKGSPDPPAPYRTQRAFPKLTFNEPLALTDAPGTDRLYVAERYGKIFHSLLRRGISVAPSAYEVGFLSLAHTTADIDRFAAVISESLAS